MKSKMDSVLKKIVLFDIDYTVFNTDFYREQIKKSFSDLLDVPPNDIDGIIAKSISATREKKGHFHPDTFLRELLGFARKDTTLQQLEQAFWDESLYGNSLYGEVEEVMHTLKKHNVVIGILSTGDKKHQRQKIHLLSDLLLDEDIHIFVDKIPELKKVIEKYKSYTVFIVDDLRKVLTTAKSAGKNVVTILITKPKDSEMKEDELAFMPDKIVSDLSEIVPIVLNK